MRLPNRIAVVTMVLALAGCALSGAKSVDPQGTYDFGTPGSVESTLTGVDYDPTCGNETLQGDGRTWFPFTPSNADEFPDPALEILPMIDGLRAAGTSGETGEASEAPYDVGTLVIYENGLAYWVSDSRAYDTWLTNRELDFTWLC